VFIYHKSLKYKHYNKTE